MWSVEDKGKNGKREVVQGFFCCMCVVWHSRTGRLVSPDSLATCDSFVVSVSSDLFLCHYYEYRCDLHHRCRQANHGLTHSFNRRVSLAQGKTNDRGSDGDGGGASSVRSQIDCLSLGRCWLYRIHTHCLVGRHKAAAERDDLMTLVNRSGHAEIGSG